MGINIADLSRLIKVSRTSIDKWKSKEGFSDCFLSDGSKELDEHKLIQWLYAWKVRAEATAVSSDPREDKLYWDARRSELRYKQEIEELVPKAQYLETEGERLHIIRQHITELPKRLAGEISLDPVRVKAVETICRNILMSIKDTFEGRADAWESFINSALPKDEGNDNA